MVPFNCSRVAPKQNCSNLINIPKPWIQTAMTVGVVAFAVFVILPNLMTIQTVLSATFTTLSTSLGTILTWAAAHPGTIVSALIVGVIVIALQKLPVKIGVELKPPPAPPPAPENPKPEKTDPEPPSPTSKKKTAPPSGTNKHTPPPQPIPLTPIHPHYPPTGYYPAPGYPYAPAFYPPPPYFPQPNQPHLITYPQPARATPIVTEVDE